MKKPLHKMRIQHSMMVEVYRKSFAYTYCGKHAEYHQVSYRGTFSFWGLRNSNASKRGVRCVEYEIDSTNGFTAIFCF